MPSRPHEEVFVILQVKYSQIQFSPTCSRRAARPGAARRADERAFPDPCANWASGSWKTAPHIGPYAAHYTNRVTHITLSGGHTDGRTDTYMKGGLRLRTAAVLVPVRPLAVVR